MGLVSILGTIALLASLFDFGISQEDQELRWHVNFGLSLGWAFAIFVFAGVVGLACVVTVMYGKHQGLFPHLDSDAERRKSNR